MDYYRSLEVHELASPEVIRAAHKTLSQIHHPDKNPDDVEAASDKMAEINEAYNTLSNPSKRTAYDFAKQIFDKKPAEQTVPVPPTRKKKVGEFVNGELAQWSNVITSIKFLAGRALLFFVIWMIVKFLVQRYVG